MSERGLRVGIAALLVVLAAGVVGAIYIRRHLGRRGRVFMAADQQTFNHPRVLQQSTVVRTLRYTAHGGTEQIVWYDGGFGPTTAPAAARIVLDADGRVLASLSRVAHYGSFETQPEVLEWFGKLPSGSHQISVRLFLTVGSYAVPYADRGTKVPDSLSVTESVG